MSALGVNAEQLAHYWANWNEFGIWRIAANEMVFVEAFQLVVPNAAGHCGDMVHIRRIDA
jgi:hypothetical protein